MEVRMMRGGDISEVLDIERRELYSELDTRQIVDWAWGEREFAPQYFVAEENYNIVGFVSLEPYEIREDEIVLQLDAIAVREEHQGQGIGRALLQTSLPYAQAHWRAHNFNLVGLVIETGTDEGGGFYEAVFPNYQKAVFSGVWEDDEGMVFYFVPLPQEF